MPAATKVTRHTPRIDAAAAMLVMMRSIDYAFLLRYIYRCQPPMPHAADGAIPLCLYAIRFASTNIYVVYESCLAIFTPDAV